MDEKMTQEELDGLIRQLLDGMRKAYKMGVCDVYGGGIEKRHLQYACDKVQEFLSITPVTGKKTGIVVTLKDLDDRGTFLYINFEKAVEFAQEAPEDTSSKKDSNIEIDFETSVKLQATSAIQDSMKKDIDHVCLWGFGNGEIEAAIAHVKDLVDDTPEIVVKQVHDEEKGAAVYIDWKLYNIENNDDEQKVVH